MSNPDRHHCRGDTLLTHLTWQEKREDVIAKCVASEPKHGEVWQRVRKDPKNAYLSTEEVLKEVMNQLQAKDVI